jgi:hypothetical protein
VSAGTGRPPVGGKGARGWSELAPQAFRGVAEARGRLAEALEDKQGERADE